MPGFVIHIAIGQEYIKKHPEEKIRKEEFIKGIIAPDITDQKSKTHYGLDSSSTNLELFLQNNKITTSYEKGYFLHLITDYEFYQKEFAIELNQIKHNQDTFYQDYDRLNERLIKKYEVILPEEIQKYVKIEKGNPKYLDYEKICHFIDQTSEEKLTKRIK